MVDERLESYIKQQLAAGYSIDAIKTNLIKYGYNPDSVQLAINSITKKPHHIIPFIPIVISITVIIIVILGIFLLVSREPHKQSIIELSASTDTKEITAGETLSFRIELANKRTSAQTDITIITELIDSAGRKILSKKISASVETTAGLNEEISLPNNLIPGTYKLKTTAYYSTKTAESSLTLSIISPEPITPQEECPSTCDDSNICTQDSCSESTSFNCMHDPITPCCGNYICESQEDSDSCPEDCFTAPEPIEPQQPSQPTEPVTPVLPTAPTAPSIYPDNIDDVISTAKDKAKKDPSDAKYYCDRLNIYQDACYNSIVDITQQSEYCSYITSISRRDNCYSYFALEKNDFSVCEKMINNRLREACINLGEVSAQS